jgi:hypothetical protein
MKVETPKAVKISFLLKDSKKLLIFYFQSPNEDIIKINPAKIVWIILTLSR